jgi:hypothetical protein
MLHADGAAVEWNPDKKRWEVHIFVGQEVIKRPIDKKIAESGEAELKTEAERVAREEGYELDPVRVALVESPDHVA